MTAEGLHSYERRNGHGLQHDPFTQTIVPAGRRGDYFEIKPENMFEMIRPD